MNKRSAKSYYFKTGRIEQLEPRNMLSGHPIAAAFSAAAFGFHRAVTSTAAHMANSVGGESTQTVLTGALTDSTSTTTGTVTYQTGSGCGGTATTSLTISVSGAAAGSTLDVAIGGVTIGTLTTDSTGAGTLALSSNPTGSQQTLPANFPTSIAAGAAVTVGSLSGTFAAATSGTNSIGSTNWSGGGSRSASTVLTASLTDPSSSATGSVTYKASTYSGTTSTKLTISVTGATSGSSLDVVIGGVTIGTLTTDSSGAGSLVFSSNPTGTELALPTNLPTISSGTTITVGSLSGTFATSTTFSTVRFARRR
jgi:hypothetical protein